MECLRENSKQQETEHDHSSISGNLNSISGNSTSTKIVNQFRGETFTAKERRSCHRFDNDLLDLSVFHQSVLTNSLFHHIFLSSFSEIQ